MAIHTSSREATAGSIPGNPDSSTRVSGVAQIFAEVFELEQVPADADFFRLGGDSFIATLLFNEIERRFGVGLSISVLLEASTPATLAGAIEAASKQRQARVLLTVRESDQSPGIFCVHGTDGESLFPRRFAKAFDQDRPIYGFRAFGLEPGESPPVTIEAMADVYLTALREAQPEGPYVILGHCAGTVTAWEVASRLRSEGRAVAGLILIDPPSHVDVAPYLHKSGLELSLFQSKSLRHAAELAARVDASKAGDGEARRDSVKAAFFNALACYVPKQLDCPTLLMCSEERRPDLLNPARGYQRLLANLRWVELSGVHAEIFDKHINEIAAEIRGFLEQGAAGMRGAQ